MRISRPNYDKYHRCPGWSGGGWSSPRRQRCDGGYVSYRDSARWRWYCHRCPDCRLLVLPWHSRWADPSWLLFAVRRAWRRRH